MRGGVVVDGNRLRCRLDPQAGSVTINRMKTVTAQEFFREGAHQQHLAEGEPVLVTNGGEPDFYVIKAGSKAVKTMEEIEAENAKIFGKKTKPSFDSLKVLRELRG
jgi:hypothetical protein